MYRDELEKVIVVIEDKAIDAYKSGYARALQIGVYNKHTQAIRQALGRLAENEFPKEAELRFSTRPGEPRVTLDRIEEVRRDQVGTAAPTPAPDASRFALRRASRASPASRASRFALRRTSRASRFALRRASRASRFALRPRAPPPRA